jgi:hypothetical protein
MNSTFQKCLLISAAVSANKLNAESGLKTASEAKAMTHAQLKAKWGFLKNIVNIDTFFASAHSQSMAEIPKVAAKVYKNV